MLLLYLGGEITTISFTPATIAGIAVIITVLGRGALAPGMQSPTLFSGVYLMPSGMGRLPMKISDWYFFTFSIAFLSDPRSDLSVWL